MKIISNIPGRIRIKDNRIYKNSNFAEVLEYNLSFISGIILNKSNSITGSLLIIYDKNELTTKKLLELVDQKIKKDLNKKQIIQEDYKKYLEAKENYKSAKKRMLVFGSTYILFKIKYHFFAKHSFSYSLMLLVIASSITILSDYPLFKKMYNKIAEYFPGNSDKFLLSLGILLAFIREGHESILLLFFKSLTDTLNYHSELKMQEFLNNKLNRNNLNECILKKRAVNVFLLINSKIFYLCFHIAHLLFITY